MKLIRPLALILPLAVAACSFEVTGPGYGDEALLKVTVSGGLLPVSYRYQVDTRGDVTGLICESGCSFAEGETLHHLTPAQQQAVFDAVRESGLPTAGQPRDFGTECCDQLSYYIIYSSGPQVRSFAGGIESLPEPLQELVRILNLLYQATPPVIFSGSDGLSGFPADALAILDASVSGDALNVDVSYGGGCTTHDVDAVVFTGFMESNPVQVGLAMTHDAHGDACDALLQPTLHFDLTPLRAAYQDAYGTDHGTIRLLLQPGNTAGSAVPHALEYTF